MLSGSDLPANNPSVEPIAQNATQPNNDCVITITPEIEERFQPVHEVIHLLLEKSVLAAIEKEYGPPESFFKASLDVISADNAISWREILIILASFSLGGLASFFVISPAGQAAETIAQIIKSMTGYHMRAVNVLKVAFQIATTGEAFSLATFSMNKMLHYYFDKQGQEEAFLIKNQATAFEIFINIFLKGLYLVSATTANIPVYFLANVIWELALGSAAANTGITWQGINGLINSLRSVHPARRVELGILHEELEKFIKLPADKQDAILAELQTLHTSELPADVKFKKIYLRLLTLSHTDVSVTPAAPAPEKTYYSREAINYGIGGLCAGAEILTFATQSGVGINSLFQRHRRGTGPIILGSLTTAASIPPCAGFGLLAGEGWAATYTSDRKPVASLANPWLRTSFRWLVRPFSALAGAMFFTLGFQTATELIAVANIRNQRLANAIKIILPSVCHIGGSIEMDFYTLSALDEIYTHYAQHCSDERLQRVLSTILAAKKCYTVLGQANDQNYFSYLNYKLEPGTELATFLLDAFEKRLTPNEREQINMDRLKYANNCPVQDSAPSSPSLYERAWCRLFGIQQKEVARDIESGLEMRERPSPI